MPERTNEIERRETAIVYAVLAQGRLGLDHDLLAVYWTREEAQELIDVQDQQLRSCLVIWDIEVGKHPSDEFWAKPRGMAGAFDALAGLPEDAIPRDRVKLGTLMASIAREAGPLTEDEAVRFVELRVQRNDDEKGSPPSPDSPGDAPVVALPSQRFVPCDEVAAAASVAPRVEYPQFRADVDAILDQSPDPRRGHRDVSTAQAALLDALARSEEDVAAGRTLPADEVIARLRKKGTGFVNDDLQRVLVAATDLSGDAARAEAWLDVPMPEYQWKTPRELVAARRADVVLVHISQLESGSSG